MAKPKKRRRKPWIVRHFSKLGFTNRLAIAILTIIALGFLGGFYLALKSISTNYLGGLACWTICFTPVSSIGGIVLARVVDKSKYENLSADGTGLSFAAAQARGFAREEFEPNDEDLSGDAPTI